MTFSGALTLTDLNDFITPSQACIKPVEAPEPEVKDDVGNASTQIEVDSSGAYHELEVGTSKRKKLKKAEISLNDCLACSGCITSAESILITAQSHLEVLNFLSSNPPSTSPAHRIPVLSIAPQSLASFAASISASSSTPAPPLRKILRRVQAFCTQELGFHRVYDTTFARHLALQEHTREFMERKGKRTILRQEKNLPLPMISSACPGWVCYAEKTHAEMIPFMSRTKSPQAIMGTLVKTWMGRKWNTSPDKVYHVSVMPCYDKKLEASRKDFYDDVFSTRDVDCVLTTGELEIMMKERGWNLSLPVEGEDDDEAVYYQKDETALPELLQHPGTSSGSYLHTLIAALSTPSSILSSKVVRTADYEEFILKDTETGEILFKGAKCYGFRNLQNVVRKVGRDAGVQTARGAAGSAAVARGGVARRRAANAGAKAGAAAANAEEARGYDFVEVMACPGGCVNGGGQIRPPASGWTPNALDTEGFPRDWAAAGVATPSSLASTTSTIPGTPASESEPFPSASSLSAKWGDKAWTARVEAAYWREDDRKHLPTPPDSPQLESTLSPGTTPPSRSSSPAAVSAGAAPSASSSGAPSTQSASTSDSLKLPSRQQTKADVMGLTVLNDVCRAPAPLTTEWMDHFSSDVSEARRRDFFRTQYHAVENENVVGLTVQW